MTLGFIYCYFDIKIRLILINIRIAYIFKVDKN